MNIKNGARIALVRAWYRGGIKKCTFFPILRIYIIDIAMNMAPIIAARDPNIS